LVTGTGIHAPLRGDTAVPNHPTEGHAGTTFHVVNRAAYGQLLFEDFGEYLLFMRLLAWALGRSPIDLFAYCLMPNHWHLLLRPEASGDLSQFMYDLTKQHAQELRRWRDNLGAGAVYQGRYRASPVRTETYFYRAARYVERNPVRARLSERADGWLWSSASGIGIIQGVRLAEWPEPRPKSWSEFVNEIESPEDLALIRKRTRRCELIDDPEAELGLSAVAIAAHAPPADDE
jgi:putative transposase